MKTGHSFSTACFCKKGHLISSDISQYPTTPFCKSCGSRTISKCAKCNAEIQGDSHSHYLEETLLSQMSYDYSPEHRTYTDYLDEKRKPNFCNNCGHPYPWTEEALSEIENTLTLENISEEDRKHILNEANIIIRDVDAKEWRVTRFKTMLSKIKPGAADVIKKILVDFGSEVLKKTMLGQ